MAKERRQGLRQRFIALTVASVGSVMASAISYGMAVYRAANPEPLRMVSLGETVDTGRWHLEIAGARTSDLPPSGRVPSEPKTFLLVDFEANNRSAVTAYLPAKLFTIASPVAEQVDPSYYLARDGAFGGALHPGMPEKMIAVWEWPERQALPDSLKLLIGSQIYKERDNLYGASNWLDRDPVAVVSLTIAQEAEKAKR